jgi:hypothetical protein
MVEVAVAQRTEVVPKGQRLEHFTVAWNALEGASSQVR